MSDRFSGTIEVEVAGDDPRDALDRLAAFAEQAVQRCTGLPAKDFTVTVAGIHQRRNGETWEDEHDR